MARPRKTARQVVNLAAPVPIADEEILLSGECAANGQAFVSAAEEYLRIDLRLDRKEFAHLEDVLCSVSPAKWMGLLTLCGLLYRSGPDILTDQEKVVLRNLQYTQRFRFLVDRDEENPLRVAEQSPEEPPASRPRQNLAERVRRNLARQREETAGAEPEVQETPPPPDSPQPPSPPAPAGQRKPSAEEIRRRLNINKGLY